MAGFAAMAGFVALLSGTSGTQDWALQIRHHRVSGQPGFCLVMHTQAASDGSGAASSGPCLAGRGSLASFGNVLPVGSAQSTNDGPSCNVVGGMTVAAGRRARVTFPGGAHMTVRVVPGPKAWRKVLGVPVRYFAADALPVSSQLYTGVVVYDARGRRVAKYHPPSY